MASIESLEVVVVPPGGTIELFRIVRSSRIQQAAVINSFRSNYELNRPPRGVEDRVALIQMGLSMFRRWSQAEGTARRFPAIGDHVARVSLGAGRGFAYADTGPPGHVTVWGRPVQLMKAVVDIKPVSF